MLEHRQKSLFFGTLGTTSLHHAKAFGRFRVWLLHGCAGSNPAFGTTLFYVIDKYRGFIPLNPGWPYNGRTPYLFFTYPLPYYLSAAPLRIIVRCVPSPGGQTADLHAQAGQEIGRRLPRGPLHNKPFDPAGSAGSW